jgi:hypothetical protein
MKPVFDHAGRHDASANVVRAQPEVDEVARGGHADRERDERHASHRGDLGAGHGERRRFLV